MKTSTVLVLGLVAFLYLQGGGARTVAATGAAPQVPAPQPQSGGGDSFNSVMAMIAATANTVGKALDLASDRGGAKQT